MQNPITGFLTKMIVIDRFTVINLLIVVNAQYFENLFMKGAQDIK